MENTLIIFDCFGVLCTEISPRWFRLRYSEEETIRLKAEYYNSADMGYYNVYELLDKLGITDKDTKFTFNQRTYSMASIQTFQEIGLANGGNIVVFNQAISGN